MSKNIAVFGLYSTREGLEGGIDELRAAGFRPTDVSVLFPENVGNKDLAHERNTKAPEGAATGALSGAIIGGTLGWLVGIGALAIPGLGPFVAAGPIMAALAGIGGALAGFGIPEYEAKRFAGRVRGGAFLLSVHCDNSDWCTRAEKILRNSGAEEISSTSESRADFANTDKPVARSSSVS